MLHNFEKEIEGILFKFDTDYLPTEGPWNISYKYNNKEHEHRLKKDLNGFWDFEADNTVLPEMLDMSVELSDAIEEFNNKDRE